MFRLVRNEQTRSARCVQGAPEGAKPVGACELSRESAIGVVLDVPFEPAFVLRSLSFSLDVLNTDGRVCLRLVRCVWWLDIEKAGSAGRSID